MVPEDTKVSSIRRPGVSSYGSPARRSEEDLLGSVHGLVRVYDSASAGRLHVDEALMEELKRVDRQAMPDQVLLVIDSMTGQDAVNSAKAFNDALKQRVESMN